MMVKLTLIQQIIDFSNGSQIIAITGCLIIQTLVLGREVSPKVEERWNNPVICGKEEGSYLWWLIPYAVLQLISLSSWGE